MQGLFNVLSSGCHAVKNKTKQQIKKEEKRKKRPALLKVKLGACVYCFIFPRRPC